MDSRPDGGALPPPTKTAGPTIPIPSSAEFPAAPTTDTPGHQRGEVEHAPMLPMAIFRLLAAGSFVGAFVLAGAQVHRVVDERTRSGGLSWGSMLIGLVCISTILAWTYTSVENARRLVSPATTQELPDPRQAVLRWAVPISFVVPAVAVVIAMSRSWNTPSEATYSSLPLLVAYGAILVTLLLLYTPLSYLAGVIRRLGGKSVSLLKWAWIPVVLAVVGAAALGALGVLGAFDANDDGIAPTWVVALLLLLPVTVVFFVGYGAAQDFEEAVARAYDRRLGRSPTLGGGRAGLPSVFGAERPNRSVLSSRGPIRLLPGTNYLRLALVSAIAGLALLSVVGALVMFLFWREAQDGNLLPSQRDRAWEVLDQLQTAERFVALGLLAIAVVWTFVNVFNARMASGRRRNPLVAALAWPVAAVGIWSLGDRITDTDDPGAVVVAFIAQAALLYLPFFLLERAATAVGARRSPFRIVYALGVVMLVHIQGLGGLSTIEQVADHDRFGRLAAYLALGGLVQLLSTLAVTEASTTISDACEHETEHHNFLIAQRQPVKAQRTAPTELVE